jgi:hypothetical protein
VDRAIDLNTQAIFKEKEVQYPFVRERPLLEEAPLKHPMV